MIFSTNKVGKGCEQMAESQKQYWQGKSGKGYSFDVYSMQWGMPQLRRLSGIYIFTRLDDETHTVIYIGQTKDLNCRLNKRFDQHGKKGCIERNCATHLHIYTARPELEKEPKRLEIEGDLIAEYCPECNDFECEEEETDPSSS